MAFFLIIILIVVKKLDNKMNDIFFNSIIGDNYNLTKYIIIIMKI